jgi:hypothetical protein
MKCTDCQNLGFIAPNEKIGWCKAPSGRRVYKVGFTIHDVTIERDCKLFKKKSVV